MTLDRNPISLGRLDGLGLAIYIEGGQLEVLKERSVVSVRGDGINKTSSYLKEVMEDEFWLKGGLRFEQDIRLEGRFVR